MTASIAARSRLREAFARSSNAATVRLAEQVGRQNVIRAARDLGIDSPLTDRPSLSLGTSGVSLLELTAAYAAIAGGRYPVEPRGLALERGGRRALGLLRSRRAAGRPARSGADARAAVGGRQ